jgi:hypothetical protein
MLSSAFFLKKKAPFAESQRARELWNRSKNEKADPDLGVGLAALLKNLWGRIVTVNVG